MEDETTKKKVSKSSRLQQEKIIKICSEPVGIPLFDPYPDSHITQYVKMIEAVCNVQYESLSEYQREIICNDPIQVLTRSQGIDSFKDKIFKKGAKSFFPISILENFVTEKLNFVYKKVCNVNEASTSLSAEGESRDLSVENKQ